MLSKILNEVKKTGFINENPFTDLDLSSYKKSNKKERFLNLNERQIIQEYCLQNHKQDLLNYIEFAIETGLRQGEQLNLEWNRVNFAKKEIYITDTKTDENRMIPLTPLAYTILQTLQASMQTLTNHKPFNAPKSTVNSQWQKLIKDLKLNKDKKLKNKLVWHSLRHTFASYSIMGLHSWQNHKPMPIVTLQKWLGHKNIKMTMRYAHLSVEDLKNEVN